MCGYIGQPTWLGQSVWLGKRIWLGRSERERERECINVYPRELTLIYSDLSARPVLLVGTSPSRNLIRFMFG